MIKLAIDVGGVLIEKRDLSGADTNFDLSYVKWVPGAIEAVEKLSTHFDLYILSFCGKRTEMETRIALRDKISHFIHENKWIFTRKREHKVKEMVKHEIWGLVDDTPMIIDLVKENGRVGILFRGKTFPDWNATCTHLIKRAQKPVPKLNNNSQFPAL